MRTAPLLAPLAFAGIVAVAPAARADDIVETAAGNKDFSKLVAEAAGLAETLSGKGPYTVFAPTDEAFEKLPAGTVEDLLKPANKSKLKPILLNHVVDGAVYSDAALKAGTAKTLGGGELTIAQKGGAAMVGDAKLVKTDIPASNGVIHVVDSVLLPKM